MTRTSVVTCDTCGIQDSECVVVYLRVRRLDMGRLRESGHGVIDMCRDCLRTKPRRSQYGRPRRLPIHEVA